MRVRAFHAMDMPPLRPAHGQRLFTLSFADEAGEVAQRVLLTGISGTGKSTVLVAMARLWRALGELLAMKPFEADMNVAMAIDALAAQPLVVYTAREEAFVDALRARYPQHAMVGWLRDVHENAWIRGAQPYPLPNMVVLDEAYEGVSPAHVPQEDWLVTDERLCMLSASDWTRALCAFALGSPERCGWFCSAVNRLLSGKRLDITHTYARVVLEDGGTHEVSQLSHGERRIVRLLYTITRCLRAGGVLLVDEPDIHLHPSQVLGLMATVDGLIARLDAQMVITSHIPAVWQRYEALGVCVRLEDAQ